MPTAEPLRTGAQWRQSASASARSRHRSAPVPRYAPEALLGTIGGAGRWPRVARSAYRGALLGTVGTQTDRHTDDANVHDVPSPVAAISCLFCRTSWYSHPYQRGHWDGTFGL